VRIWDAETLSATSSRARSVLARHSAMVYDLTWSPDASLIATAGADKKVLIWSSRDGTVVKSFNGPASAFAVSFHASGTRLAASFATGAVSVIDLRM
jgi:transducin (beta)-like 1